MCVTKHLLVAIDFHCMDKYTMEVNGYQQRNNNDNISFWGFKSQFWNLLDRHLRKSGWIEKL